MKRELGIARCGLACCLCTENVTCNGCDSNGCPDNEFCENKKCSVAKELSHCYKCEENCRKGLLSKIKPYTFTLFGKKYGEGKLLDWLERNEKNQKKLLLSNFILMDWGKDGMEWITAIRYVNLSRKPIRK